jgi:integral membrane protein
MPMKYFFNDPIYVKQIGMAHGVLFTAYIVLATILKFSEKWDLKSIL